MPAEKQRAALRFVWLTRFALSGVLLTLLTAAPGADRRVSRVTNAPQTIEAPEIVRLSFNRAKNNLCTGIVLTRRIILTAAHCLENPADVTVSYYDTLGTDGTPVYPSTGGFGPATYYPHPDFSRALLRHNNNDIGVIRLADPGMSTYVPARIYFDGRRPWMPHSGVNSRRDRRVHAFGVGKGSPAGSSSDCEAGGNTVAMKRRADRLYVHIVDQWVAAAGEPRKIAATMDGQHLCGGDSGGAWTLKRNEGQQPRFLTFAIHFDHDEDWWYDTAWGTSIRPYWEWIVSRANHANVSLACPTSVLPGSGYRYKTCRENAAGSECVTGQTRHRDCSGNFSGPGLDETCVAGFWQTTGGRCEPRAPPGGQRP